MPNRNRADATQIELRRALVSEYRLAGLSLRDIAQKLMDDHDIYNFNTGKPFSAPTIMKDDEANKELYRQRALVAVEELRAQQLAEIQWLRRRAKQLDDLSEARLLVALEMQLMGTTKPAAGPADANVHDVRITLALPEKGTGGWEVVEQAQIEAET